MTLNIQNGFTFMYKRLVLAKDLLAETGVIFISIDDNEQAHLKLLCDEILGKGILLVTTFGIKNLLGATTIKT